MQIREFEGANSFLKGIANDLLQHGVRRHVRGFDTYELPNPVIIKIINPRARLITVKEREWNSTLPFVESLWLASGRNDMAMIGYYLNKMYSFSDDNETMRAAYGPRLRFFNGLRKDYKIDSNKQRVIDQTATKEVDQFKYVVGAFQKDMFTRQGIISIVDPAKDYFDVEGQLKNTKDFPCTTNLQFIRNGDKLDLITHMRSNDFLWGASAVNIFNFTFIQEYFSRFLNLELGNYYHVVNNLHYYGDYQSKIEQLANIQDIHDSGFEYKNLPVSLGDFDCLVNKLEQYELDLREKKLSYILDFGNDFFNDWGKVFYAYHNRNELVEFVNPILQTVIQEKHKKVLPDV